MTAKNNAQNVAAQTVADAAQTEVIAPQPEISAKREQPAAPAPVMTQPQAAPHNNSTTLQPSVPARRVGTITMGVALILSGVLLCVCLFWPTYEVVNLFRFAPLLLALLGVEILVSYARAKTVPIKYDVLSMLLCVLLIMCAVGATGVAIAATQMNMCITRF